MTRLFVFINILLLCFSCRQGEVYYNFKDLKGGEWDQRDTLVFDIDSSLIDVNAKYDLSIESVNNTEYKYQNLWLYVKSDIDNKYTKVDQREYMLADSLGKWYGDGFGSTYQLSLPFRKKISFPQKKNYKIKIIHGMKDEPLLGIEKIGLKLSLSDQ